MIIIFFWRQLIKKSFVNKQCFAFLCLLSNQIKWNALKNYVFYYKQLKISCFFYLFINLFPSILLLILTNKQTIFIF